MKRHWIYLLSLAILVSCGNQDPRQPGPRYSLASVTGGQTMSIMRAPAQISGQSQTDWPVHLGSNTHMQPNAVFQGAPNLIAASNLGPMGRRPVYGASLPIIVGNRIYHYDAGGHLNAFTLNGQKLWTHSMIPLGESVGDGFGGGLAYQNGVVYVTTGYGEVLAVNGQNGSIKWRFRQKNPLRKPPLVAGGQVVILAGGSTAIGLNANSGTVNWRRYSAQAILPSRINGGAPAARGTQAAIAYSSGELAWVDLRNGKSAWEITSISDSFSGSKSLIGDVTADPVIASGQIILGTQSGLASVDANTGQIGWSNTLGAKGSVIVSGNSVVGVTPSSQLYRLSKSTGQPAWVTNLPRDDGQDLFAREIEHFEPRLAASSVYIADNIGNMRRYSIESGALTGIWELEAPLASTPVFGQGLMVGIGKNGQLLIYR